MCSMSNNILTVDKMICRMFSTTKRKSLPSIVSSIALVAAAVFIVIVRWIIICRQGHGGRWHRYLMFYLYILTKIYKSNKEYVQIKHIWHGCHLPPWPCLYIIIHRTITTKTAAVTNVHLLDKPHLKSNRIESNQRTYDIK